MANSTALRDVSISELVSDIEKQRKGYQNGKVRVIPMGRLDIFGDYRRQELSDVLNKHRKDLGISSIEDLVGYTCVIFDNGLRTYDIDLGMG